MKKNEKNEKKLTKKLTKNKKIILLGAIIGILVPSIVVPIVLTSKNNDQKNQNKEDVLGLIKDKITDKDIIIAPNVPTQNQSEIQSAILEQLKVDNNTLTNEDIKKITTSISSLEIGTRTEVELTIAHNQKSEKIIINAEKINLLKGSNIDGDSQYGIIFQDSFKNLWAMGHTKLQVLEKNQNGDGYVATGWKDDNSDTATGLLKGSNITSGKQGTIFQDQFKNLWAVGYDTKPQVLKAKSDGSGYDVNTGWIDDNSSSGDSLLKGSNITEGVVTIFQDDFGNLWAMGSGTKLQVLKAKADGSGYVTTGWIDDNSSSGDPLLKNSKIDTNLDGVIFQDKFKNLWATGSGFKLQVLKAKADGSGYDLTTGWIDDNNAITGDPLLKNSNIIDGQYSKIFQDDFGNLWAMGNGKKLQVLKADGDGYVTTGWIDDNSSSGDPLLKNSKIDFGQQGTIFQDKFKNLWTLGWKEKLQVLETNSDATGYVTTGWSDDNGADGKKLLKDSSIVYGDNGIIFQDDFGNLWTSGSKINYGALKPQVLQANQNDVEYADSWTNDNNENDKKLLNGLTIMIGQGLVIFQDEFKNLWAMGKHKAPQVGQKLQVLKVNVAKDGYVDSWQSE